MNPSSYSTFLEHPVEGTNLLNAVYITGNPIFAEDAMEENFMLEDSTNESTFYDILADKFPFSTSPPSPPISSNSYWNSCFNFVKSDMISDLARCETGCMLPQQVTDVFQNYPQPISESLILPGSNFVEAVGSGVKGTAQISIAYANQVDETDRSFCKTMKVQSCGKGDIGREYGRVVCPEYFELPDMFISDVSLWQNQAKGNVDGTTQRRSVHNKRKLVDLRTLLIQCAEAVGANDFRNAKDFLMQIKIHASPSGNASQRKAYYFFRALEARLAGTGSRAYAALASKTIPISDIESCRLLISACPFMKVSNFFTTETIMKLTQRAATLHIIHFGVPCGMQWSSLIQRLSTRSGKFPPTLRVTGIDLPQPGSHSAARVAETGVFLENCCKQFNIPFEYNGITKNWDRIQVEDLKLGKHEVIVVNCLYRLRHVIDETSDLSSPRDNVLNLIRKINPDVFIHGIVCGTYTAPFFVSRFKEAIYHFSTIFDMLEEIAPSEHEERRVVEENIYEKEILNVVACEGEERVERPETHKQWQVRNLRAGFRQLPLDQEMLKKAKEHVKLHYHKDFVVYEEKNWMLQGWKGKNLFALSFWKP